jgi:hypothetical protein
METSFLLSQNRVRHQQNPSTPFSKERHACCLGVKPAQSSACHDPAAEPNRPRSAWPTVSETGPWGVALSMHSACTARACSARGMLRACVVAQLVAAH